MKRTLGASTLAIAVGLVAVSSAQAPAPRPQDPAPMKDDKMVSVTGCLRTGNEAGSFVLANVSDDTAARPPESDPPVPSTPAMDRGPAAPGYKLIAASGVDLKSHVGHKVSVAGSLEPLAAAPASPEGATLDVKNLKTLRVVALKMVSQTCTPPSIQ